MVRRLFAWCECHRIGQLADIEPLPTSRRSGKTTVLDAGPARALLGEQQRSPLGSFRPKPPSAVPCLPAQ